MASKETQLSELDKQIAAPDFWDEPQSAQKISKIAAALRDELESWQAFVQRVHDARELVEMGDDSMRGELEAEIGLIETQLDKRAFTAMLSGKYDEGDAILAIHAGAGGTDSQDWAEMIQRMYLRWAEAQGFKTEILDTTLGEEAGIKSVTIAISGQYAFGYLRSE